MPQIILLMAQVKLMFLYRVRWYSHRYATITITVNGVNNEVSGTNDTGSVTDGNTLSIGNKSSGLLSNDTDSGSDADESANATVSAVGTGTEAGTVQAARWDPL